MSAILLSHIELIFFITVFISLICHVIKKFPLLFLHDTFGVHKFYLLNRYIKVF